MADTDILIVGAGLAGLPIALACAHSGWQVTLVDKNAAADPSPTDPLDQRCTAIGSGSEQLLKRWGVWPHIESDAEAILEVQVSQQGYFGSTRLRATEQGVKALGYVIENRRWVETITQAVEQHPNIKLIRSDSVASVSDADESIDVTLDSGSTLSAQLLIASDGINSRVRDLVGVGDSHFDFEQSAMMTTLRFADAHESVAYERFSPQGPVAFLPRPGKVMSVVWCLDTDNAKTYQDAQVEDLIAQLQEVIGFRMGRIEAMGARVIVPLIRREAVTQVGTRTVLLGNSARLLHPVAGQGFNLVLRDAAGLLDAIGQRTDERALDPGDASLLTRFAESRKADQQRVVTLTDTLAKSFRGKASLPGHARACALIGLDNLGPLRDGFAARTMGFTG